MNFRIEGLASFVALGGCSSFERGQGQIQLQGRLQGQLQGRHQHQLHQHLRKGKGRVLEEEKRKKNSKLTHKKKNKKQKTKKQTLLHKGLSHVSKSRVIQKRRQIRGTTSRSSTLFSEFLFRRFKRVFHLRVVGVEGESSFVAGHRFFVVLEVEVGESV